MIKLRYVPKYDMSSILNTKNSKISVPFTWYTLIATWFYVGRIFPMPGTFGSLATFPIYYLVLKNAESINHVTQIFWIIFIVLLAIGYFAVCKFESATGSHDHKSLVIDEVLGMLIIFCISFPSAYELSTKLYKYIEIKPTYLCFAIIFVIFRYFDIRKPFFIGYIDKSMHNSFSVILDDLVAALFSCLTLSIINMILSRII